ncbi:MAG: hypothetical protein EBU90_25530 [Proteobacteria bacterium]|nr:hypothetical protein [Pseudomonadota bacterium]
MQDSRRFILKIDAIKQEIENRHKREFVKLYRSIGNDLINIVTNTNNASFNGIIQNHKPQYTALFHKIFQNAKENGMGFEIRKQFNFNKRNIIELKSVEVPKTEQDKVNNRFDVLYTVLINTKPQELISNDFLESETKYFENLYTNAQEDYIKYVNDIEKKINQTRTELLLLAGAVLASQIQRRKNLQKQLETFEKQLVTVRENAKTETVKQFKNQLETKIPVRSQSNAEYGTGQASSEIREAEYQAFKESGATEAPSPSSGGVVAGLLASRIQKVWWEKSQFIRGSQPRINHLAISGSQADRQGNFYVSGYEVPHPRHSSLPASESARCRCEVEYIVN